MQKKIGQYLFSVKSYDNSKLRKSTKKFQRTKSSRENTQKVHFLQKTLHIYI